jgi:hypothetical protein
LSYIAVAVVQRVAVGADWSEFIYICDVQVPVAVVVYVGEYGAGIFRIDVRLPDQFRYVVKGSIATIAVKKVVVASSSADEPVGPVVAVVVNPRGEVAW